MGLSRQIIHLRRPDLRNQPHQVTGIRGIRIMEKKFDFMIIGRNQMINSRRICNTVPADQAVHLIPLVQ